MAHGRRDAARTRSLSTACQALSVVTQQRVEEVQSIVRQIVQWATIQADVRGVVVIGSWATKAARMDSDVDIVVLAAGSASLNPDPWLRLLSGRLFRQQNWGPLREIRLARPSGLEVELGIVPPSWAKTDPVDTGTFQVINAGHHVAYDPDGALAALAIVCR